MSPSELWRLNIPGFHCCLSLEETSQYGSLPFQLLTFVYPCDPCTSLRCTDLLSIYYYRYAFTVISNLTVYLLALLFLSLGSKHGLPSGDDITPADNSTFKVCIHFSIAPSPHISHHHHTYRIITVHIAPTCNIKRVLKS